MIYLLYCDTITSGSNGNSITKPITLPMQSSLWYQLYFLISLFLPYLWTRKRIVLFLEPIFGAKLRFENIDSTNSTSCIRLKGG